MPLNIDLNVSPYFDDYDEAKNYHRILFRPSVAVQARELTQAQTILQNQIERFGSWAFKSGDIVEGCTIADIPVLPYVFLNDAASNGSANSVSFDAREYVNCVAVSTTSNLQAKIVFANVGFQANYPNSNIIYLKYLNTGNGNLNSIRTEGANTSGEKIFANSEMLQIINVQPAGNTTLANVYTVANTSSQNATGYGHGISVSEGIIFINGVFVRVESATLGIVKRYDTNAGNSVVGFVLTEEIVTENEDSTLLDNALGYSNENAPGARRLKLTPELVAYANAEAAAANSKNFNSIAQYNFNTLVQKTTDNELYSTIGKAIAKRTYEESGNYVVNPFFVDTVTDIASSVVADPTANTVIGRISPGVGYAQGQRVSLEKTTYIDMRRGVDTETRDTQQITFNYGGYYQLKEVAGSFDFSGAQRVNLYANTMKAVTNKSFSSVSLSGKTLIGNAAVRMFTYESGTPGSNSATYLLHVCDVKLAAGYKPDDVQSVYYSSGGSVAVGDLAKTGLQKGSSKSMLFTYGKDLSIKNYLNADLDNNMFYTYRKKVAGKTMNSSGVVSVTGAAGGTAGQLAYGLGELSAVDASTFTLVARANTDSNSLGNVSITAACTVITAVDGASFNDFAVGDLIKVTGDSQPKTIVSISNSTSLVVESGTTETNSQAHFYLSYIDGKEIPLNTGASGAYINVVSNSEFTIYTNRSISSSMSVDVVYDVMKMQATPAKKDIKRSRFVRIDTSTTPKGPWCLGFSDVFRINKIYASASTYTTSGIDVTRKFVFDTGQKDTHYDLAYLYNISHDVISYPKLLVELDYFVANTTSGIGFFTVDSYPIDDANTANTLAIQTKDIPLYVDESGNKIPLKNYIDFRIPSVSTANNTGNCNTANPTEVTTAISYSTLNPSSALTFDTGTGLNPPSYAKNLSSDVTYYLPRKDLIFITADNIVKVKEGVSSLEPKTPIYPENAMPIAVVSITPYPSLSTDQLDSLLPYNQSSKSLIRDTRTSIASSVITNRGYTMRDIAKLDQRITNLEYYTQLTLLERKATDMQVIDANGLNRFKNGIFVDNFTDYSAQLPSDPDYRLAIDQQKGVGRPYISRKTIAVDYNADTSTGVQVTGRLITLPYTSTPQITQSNSTKYRSAALVASQWNGSINLFPPNDNQINLDATGSLSATIDETTGWKEFAASPYGSRYGDWRTSSSSVTTSVKSGEKRTITKTIGIDLGFMPGSKELSRNQLYDLLVANGENPPQNFIIGSVATFYNGGYSAVAGSRGVQNWIQIGDRREVWGAGQWR